MIWDQTRHVYLQTMIQRVNREVLRWVKEWDYCVFGKLPSSENQRKAFRNYKSTFGSSLAGKETDNIDKVFIGRDLIT